MSDQSDEGFRSSIDKNLSLSTIMLTAFGVVPEIPVTMLLYMDIYLKLV